MGKASRAVADREIVKTVCPRDCYDGCGIAVVRREGRIRRVLGDPDHPVARGALCGKCAVAYNGVWLDESARLLTPLRRTGAKDADPSGPPSFASAGWDPALSAIAGELKRIVADHGPDTILDIHYTGTNSIVAGNFPLRFFNRLGATEVNGDTVCNHAGYVALNYVYGTAVHGFDPRTAKDARCILVWGANPSATAPHAHKHWLRESQAKVLVVDPVRHPTAREADLHLQLRPGTDAALAFAMLHVMRRDGLLDLDYLARHALGWEEIEPLLGDCTPEWGQGVTGVPAETIAEAATLYAEGPSLLWIGQGLARQPLGGNAVRACAMLPAATGNIGRPGAGFLFLNGKGRRGIDMDWLTGATLRPDPAPPEVSHMDLAARLEDCAATRAAIVWNMNPLASGPEQSRLRAAFARDDLFTVVIDPFLTDTARLADWVLPAASFLEFGDLVSSYFHLNLAAQCKAGEPMGASLPNQEIFRRLAVAMGFDDPALQETDASLLDTLVRQTRLAADFTALAGQGATWVSGEPVLQFPEGVFPTPSGRIELASPAAEAAGHPRTPLPVVDTAPEEGWLRLLSPASPWHLNSSYSNDPRIRKLADGRTVTIHPEDAASRELREGEMVWLENASGRLAARSRLSDEVPVGSVLVPKGGWPSLDADRANVNLLNGGCRTDMGDTNGVHGVRIRIERA